MTDDRGIRNLHQLEILTVPSIGERLWTMVPYKTQQLLIKPYPDTQ